MRVCASQQQPLVAPHAACQQQPPVDIHAACQQQPPVDIHPASRTYFGLGFMRINILV